MEIGSNSMRNPKDSQNTKMFLPTPLATTQRQKKQVTA